MSIYYGSNSANVVSTIATNGTYTISFDATAFPVLVNDSGPHFWFVFSNNSVNPGDGVTVGPFITDTVWDSDPANYANLTGNIVSISFTFPNVPTTFNAYGPVLRSYDPAAPQTFLSLYGSDINFGNYTELLVGQPVTVTFSAPPEPITCFKEDSKILTIEGYKRVQELRKGDLVKTINHDYVPIAMIGKKEIYHPASTDRIKDQLYKCSKDGFEEVFEDLMITGCHSILVDKFSSEKQKEKAVEVNKKIYITDNKYRVPACAHEKASVYEIAGKYTIYHFALENEDYYMNYGVYANGLLVETCSKRYLKELSNMELIE